MNEQAFDGSASQRWQRRFLVAGSAGLLLCAVGALIDIEQSLRSYLIGYFSWLGMALGSLGLLMLHNLTGGAWGFAIRGPLQAAARTLPLLTLFFLPIAAGAFWIYPWTAAPTDYLNLPFFLIRSVIYFGIWLTAASVLKRGPSDGIAQNFSGPGLVLLALTVTFASIDWIMSLEPDWYSTIFGAMVGSAQLLTALALAIGMATLIRAADRTFAEAWNDLGNLLLAFVMLWTYMEFSQFLLIWSGNLPEEITWYLHRTEGGWQWVGLSLAVGYFALPFCLLLSSDLKRTPGGLRVVAFLIVAMSVVQNFWLIAPAFSPSQLYLSWIDVAAGVGVGGVWSSQFLRYWRTAPQYSIAGSATGEAVHA
jgi:hypothetical protein